MPNQFANRKLILGSNSLCYGQEFLAHCYDLAGLFGARKVVVLPYAGVASQGYENDVWLKRADTIMRGLALHGVNDTFTLSPDGAADWLSRADPELHGIFIGGGNTFFLQKQLLNSGLHHYIRRAGNSGLPIAGFSAGANIMGPTMMTTNDKPIVHVESFGTCGLVSFQINPHYVDADKNSTYRGETREQQLLEFLVVNPRATVLGLREGAWLLVDRGSIWLRGHNGAVILRHEGAPVEVEVGSDLSYLQSE